MSRALVVSLVLASSACASPPPGASPPQDFTAFARKQVFDIRGGRYVREIIRMRTSPDQRVACGAVRVRRSANVFAVVLDQPYPNQTRVEVMAPPDFPQRPTPQESRAVGMENLRVMGEIARLCTAAGAPL